MSELNDKNRTNSRLKDHLSRPPFPKGIRKTVQIGRDEVPAKVKLDRPRHSITHGYNNRFLIIRNSCLAICFFSFTGKQKLTALYTGMHQNFPFNLNGECLRIS